MEPFKNLLNETVIKGMARNFKRNWPAFDDKGFVAAATKDLDSLELKARTNQITESMIKYLPADYDDAGKIMLASLGPSLDDEASKGSIDTEGISGWALTALADYVGLRGHAHFDLSMNLFKQITKRFSSEFGIRFFILESPERTLSVLKTWVTDPNKHVRRLVSEGTRPRLPWAMQLPMYIKDPAPIIGLLELLKDDESEYVRRSVANSLNDISKDHPEVVVALASRWMKSASKARVKLIRHGCRTLFKSGDKEVLKVFGYKSPKIKPTRIEILTPEVMFGTALEFTLSLCSESKRDQALMVDYIIHHVKANGKTSPKVFKWKTTSLPANKVLSSTKKHTIKKITTRVYYPGMHTVEAIVNGVSVAKADFVLLMPELT